MGDVINILEGSEEVYRRKAREIDRAFSRGDNDRGYDLFNGIGLNVIEYLSMESLRGLSEMQGISLENCSQSILRRLIDEGHLKDIGGKK